MGFTQGCLVEFLEIHGSLGCAILFGVTTIREHQTVGVPCGTGSMMPRSTSLSRASFTAFFQWCGTGIGECTADGVASGRNVMLMGFPVMV